MPPRPPGYIPPPAPQGCDVGRTSAAAPPRGRSPGYASAAAASDPARPVSPSRHGPPDPTCLQAQRRASPRPLACASRGLEYGKGGTPSEAAASPRVQLSPAATAASFHAALVASSSGSRLWESPPQHVAVGGADLSEVGVWCGLRGGGQPLQCSLWTLQKSATKNGVRYTHSLTLEYNSWCHNSY